MFWAIVVVLAASIAAVIWVLARTTPVWVRSIMVVMAVGLVVGSACAIEDHAMIPRARAQIGR